MEGTRCVREYGNIVLRYIDKQKELYKLSPDVYLYLESCENEVKRAVFFAERCLWPVLDSMELITMSHKNARSAWMTAPGADIENA